MAAVGDDADGRFVRRALRTAGVITRRLVVDAACPTTVAVVQVDRRFDRLYLCELLTGPQDRAAQQALLRAEKAQAEGDVDGVTKWTNIAQAQATKLQAAENNLTSLTGQYEMAISQAEEAKAAVVANAARLQELSAKQMELLGALEQAKMQESVNAAVQSMSATMDDSMPSLEDVADKIEKRKAQAMGQAEVFDVTPEGGEIELRQALNEAQADAKLEELKAELGLTDVAEPAPAPEAEGEASGTTS